MFLEGHLQKRGSRLDETQFFHFFERLWNERRTFSKYCGLGRFWTVLGTRRGHFFRIWAPLWAPFGSMLGPLGCLFRIKKSGFSFWSAWGGPCSIFGPFGSLFRIKKYCFSSCSALGGPRVDFWTSCGVFASFWELFGRDFGVILEGCRDEKQRTAGALPCWVSWNSFCNLTPACLPGFALLCLALPCITLVLLALACFCLAFACFCFLLFASACC